jgi:hypothetical protein
MQIFFLAILFKVNCVHVCLGSNFFYQYFNDFKTLRFIIFKIFFSILLNFKLFFTNRWKRVKYFFFRVYLSWISKLLWKFIIDINTNVIVLFCNLSVFKLRFIWPASLYIISLLSIFPIVNNIHSNFLYIIWQSYILLLW